MKHRDPRLFYLTMEVNIGEDRSRTIALEDGSCLADLISCNPWGSCRFRLKARAGGLVRIHDGAVRTDSVYKSIILSADTTVEDTVGILGGCYSAENGTGLQLFEVDTHTGEERLLAGTEKPLEILEEWGKDGGKVFQLRRTREEIGENSSSPPPCEPRLSVEPFSRSLVRNSVLRQSIRKKQFFKSMICERSLNCEELGDELELEPKQFFSLGRFRLSDQIISETGEDPEDGGSDLENTSEGDLNCSTSGVSSLSCSSLDSEGVQENRSFYT